ncbi:hypothetical protein WA026_022547 [Henosepilachna vigintioctopunctata]|uniref:Uncharacterized protein n=1 Tax=Henosepilachna vigintioctopunctata TaxID=420089 RepID=A0AAW1VHG6_9CUCU
MISSNPNTYHTLMVIMNLKCLSLVLLKICLTQCSVLLWSNKQVDVLPLQKFSDTELNVLLEKMAYPEVVAYNNPNQNIPTVFKELMDGSYSAYNTNEYLESINSTELTGDEKSDFMRIKDDIDYARQNRPNTLFLIISGSAIG